MSHLKRTFSCQRITDQDVFTAANCFQLVVAQQCNAADKSMQEGELHISRSDARGREGTRRQELKSLIRVFKAKSYVISGPSSPHNFSSYERLYISSYKLYTQAYFSHATHCKAFFSPPPSPNHLRLAMLSCSRFTIRYLSPDRSTSN